MNQSPTAPPRRVYAVHELSQLLRGLLEDSLPRVWVEGELSNLRSPSGHWYFSLKDEQSQLRCAMFRGNNIHVRPRPNDGDQVLIRGRVTLYEPRGGLPEHMKLKLIEPLRELFKDEVRKLGVELGLPREMVYRHPFPGPGLGVRILGEVTKAAADTLRKADHIFIEELRRAGWYDKTSQAFAVFLPVKSVGVTGDGRRHEPVVALRAVETVDFMTARWARLPYELLDLCSRRIINEVPGLSRVVYDISGKPPATIEWE